MHKLVQSVAVLSLLITAAACAPQPTATPIPTQPPAPSAVGEPSQTLEPTWTPVERRTLPPEWTLTFTASMTPSITPTVPTSTPTHTPTLTPIPTIDAIGTVLAGQPPREGCAQFRVDESISAFDFVFGSDPVVNWTAMQGAAGYKVTLLNGARDAIFETITPLLTITFSANFFAIDDIYAWEVRPLSSEALQLCQPIGSALVPSV
jgi:hypothetical protein